MDAPPAKPSYRRLPGRAVLLRLGRGFGSGGALWLGPDHLLKVDVRPSRETYKRFYFRDIQAVFLEQSARANHITIFTTLSIAIIFLLTFAFSRTFHSGLPVALILSSPFIVGLVVNLVLGKTSRAVLFTAVGTESLPSLCRLHRAATAIQQITAEVAKTQGEAPTAHLVALWPAPSAPPSTS